MIADQENERVGLLKTIEQYATRFLKVSGHNCALRAMCEAAETPFHTEGLLGEAVNALLIPSYLLEMVPELADPDYLEAHKRGQEQGNCTVYHDMCPMSFFKVRVLYRNEKCVIIYDNFSFQTVEEPDEYYDFLGHNQHHYASEDREEEDYGIEANEV
jgi:hypothetical protein